MNRIFNKFIALAVSAAMLIPTAAFATADQAEVVDTTELVETVEAAEDEVVETETFADLKKAVYADLTVGETEDIVTNSSGDDTKNMKISAAMYEFVRHEDHADGANHESTVEWCVNCNTDGAVTKMQAGGEWAYYTTLYRATGTTDETRFYRNGCMGFHANYAFTDETYTEYVMELDYYADKADTIRIGYYGGASKITFTKDYSDAEGPAWKTFTSDVLTDFKPYATDTGLGIKEEGQDGSKADGAFRLETPAKGTNIYIKGVRIYTPGYPELKQAIESIEIANADELKDNFTVPVSMDDVQIQWTSDNSAISIDADGNATVTRDANNNISGNLTATAVLNGYYLDVVIPTTVFTSNEAQAELDDHMDNFTLGVSDAANVTTSFALPVAPDGYEYEWASTNEDYIDVSDGVTAVVNPSKFMDSSATILVTVYHGDKFAEEEFTLSAPALYSEAKGASLIINNDGDIATGGMKAGGAFGTYTVYDVPTIPTDADGNPYGANPTWYVTDSSSDFGNARTTIGGSDAVMGGHCYSTTRKTGGVAGNYYNFNVPFDVGTVFTEEDKTVKVTFEYYDPADVTGTITVKYTTTPQLEGKTYATTVVGQTVSYEGTGEWKTSSFVTAGDAYFVADPDNKTGLGSGSTSDLRFEASGCPLYIRKVSVEIGDYEAVASAKEAVTIEGVDLANVTENFTLPTIADGDVEIEWSSSDESIIDVDGDVAYIYPSVDGKLTATLTAAIMKNGSYTTKEFEVTLAKLPKKSPVVGDAVVTTGDTTTNISYTIEGTGNIRGTQLFAMAIITETATGRIIAKQSGTAMVNSDITVVDVDIQNPVSGQELTHYVVNEIGAVVKNRAPAALTGVTGKSTKTGGRVIWNAIGDDYNHVVYDVYKDGVLWIEGTEETVAEYQTESTTPSNFYVVARDHEGIATAPSAQVQASRYIPVYYDVNEDNESTVVVYGMTHSYSLDKVTRYTTKTGADTVDGDGVTPVTLKAVTTVTGAERLANGAPSNKGGASRMQWRADNIADNENHVVILVKYFDEGTGNVEVNYSSQPNGSLKAIKEAFTLTGTNTWKEAVIILEDAAFINASNGVEGDDFFFRTSANGGVIAITKVTVMPYEYY